VLVRVNPVGERIAARRQFAREQRGQIVVVRTGRPIVKIGARSGAIVHAAVVDAAASIGPYAVIGARARVSAGPPIDHTVIWEEAIARGPLSHAIVTPRATVAV